MAKENKFAKCFIYLMIWLYFFLADVISYASGQSGYAKYALLAALLIAFLVYIFTNSGIINFQITEYHIFLICFTGYIFLSAIWAKSSQLSISRGIDIFEITISMFIIYLFFQDEASMDSLYQIIMWAGYAVVVYSIYFYGVDYFVDRLTRSVRMSSWGINANLLGMCAAYSITIHFYFILKKKKIWAFPMIAVSALILAASGSKKAIFIVVIGVVSLFMLKCVDSENYAKTLLRWFIMGLFLSLAMFYLSKLPAFDIVNDRIDDMLESFQEGDGDESTNARMQLIEIGVSLFEESPIGGVGFSNPRIYAGDRIGIFTYLHNNYIEILAGGGVLGFLVYYSIFGYCAIMLLRYHDFQNMEYNLALILLAVFLIMDYGNVSYESKSTYLYIMIFFMASQKAKNKHIETWEKERNTRVSF